MMNDLVIIGLFGLLVAIMLVMLGTIGLVSWWIRRDK